MASNPSLQAGKAALEQGNYPQAIALLQFICTVELDENIVAQAQNLLILAYEGAGDTTAATKLRQSLNTNLQTINLQTPDNTTLESANNPANNPATDIALESTAIASTGFTPLTTPDASSFPPLAETGTEIPKSEITNTGFTPLADEAGKKSPRKGSSPSPQSFNKSLNKQGLDRKDNIPSSSSNPRSSSPDTKPEKPEPVALVPIPQRLPSLFAEAVPIPWRNADRAKNWSPLKGIKLKKSWLLELAIALGFYFLVNFVLGRFFFVRELTNVALFFAVYQVLGRFWMVNLGTVIAFFWLLRLMVTMGMAGINGILANLAIIRLQPIQAFYRDPTYFLVGMIAIVAIASPWLWDFLLQKGYNLKPLSVNQLSSKSPEALKLLRSFSKQKKFPFPTLKVLPTATPLAFTYGHLPKTIRIVVSQGLLDTLTEAETATIYAAEVGHIINGDYALTSIAVLILQIPYTFYWQVAYWGERLAELSRQKLPSYKKFLPIAITWICAIAANLSYSIFWILRLPLFWSCRLKTYYGDRVAASITGNPNALARSILKIAITTAQEMERQGQSNWLIEGVDLLTPLGYHQALLLGGSYRQLLNPGISQDSSTTDPLANLLKLLNWDCLNSCRQWLVWGYGHPLTGDRLAVLNRYAQYWKLNPELDLPQPPATKKSKKSQLSLKIIPEFIGYTKGLPLLQRAAIYGVAIGLILRVLLWILGAIGYQFYVIEIVWLFKNANPFHTGCFLIATGVAIFLLINSYFPDIKPSIAKTELHIGSLLTDPKAMPSQTKTARMTGQLLGRRGISNWLGQDLWLQTPQGLIKLNFLSALGAWGNVFLNQKLRPSDLVNRQVTVLGWWRRGVTPWIDVETIRSPGTKAISGNYPIWATLLGLGSVLWGTYIIWQA